MRGAATVALPVALGWVALGSAGASRPARAEPAVVDVPVRDTPGVVDIRADDVRLTDGRAEGEGHVVVTLAGDTVTGERFRLDADRGVLIIEQGTWQRAEGTLRFARAEVAMGGATAAVVDGRFEGVPGPLVLSGASLGWSGEDGGTLTGEDVHFSMCGCEPGPWSVQARRVTARLDDAATFSGAWIRICDLPVLPVPWGMVPLTDRRTGFLVPRAGWGRDGAQVSAPFFLAVGESADLTVEPEWRADRGLRAMAEGRAALAPGQDATLRVAGGWDTQRDVTRGAVDLAHAWTPGRLRTASDVLWLSDSEYLSDHGGDFLTRTTPWAEFRAVVGLGEGRVESDLFQAEDDVAQRPISGVLRWAGLPAGPLAVTLGARADAIADPASGWARPTAGATESRLVGDAALTSGRQIGPARIDGTVSGRMVQWIDADAWAEASARLGGTVESWTGLSGAGVLLHEVGVEAEATAAATAGGVEPPVLLPDEVRPPAWSIGPVAKTRWLSPAGVPVSAELTAPWTPSGPMPEARVRAGVGPVDARAQASRDLQAAWAWWDDGVGRVAAGLIRATGPSVRPLTTLGLTTPSDDDWEPLLVGSTSVAWTLPGPLSEWRPGWRGLYDVEGGRFLSQGPTLSYTSRCQCLTAAASATWSADRPVPQVGLSVDLR